MPEPLAKDHDDPTGATFADLRPEGGPSGTFNSTGMRLGSVPAHPMLHGPLSQEGHIVPDSVSPWGAEGVYRLATLPPVFTRHPGYKNAPGPGGGPKFLTPGVSLNQSLQEPNFIGRSQDHVRTK